MAFAINYAALSADQVEEMLTNLKQEMVDRTAKAEYAAAQEWHAKSYAGFSAVRAKKNAELMAAGKVRINACHIAQFIRWHRYLYSYEDNSIADTFPEWFASNQHLFPLRKVAAPKVKPEDLPVAERLRRLAFAAAHINQRVANLTEKVVAETTVLAEMMAAKQQVLIKEHTPLEIQVADYDIETAQYYLYRTTDLLERSKKTQRKFAEKHC
jgi:hypothetical protein